MAQRAARIVCEKCGGKMVAGSRFCNSCGAPAPATSPFEVDARVASTPIEPGEVLEGKWRVDAKIGQGGMGSVYRCTDLALDRVVAVKVLASDLCQDEVFVARFEREAKLTAGLEQPNVVLIYAVGRHLGRPFIVMKWLAGQTLSKKIDLHAANGTRMPFAEVRSIVSQICAGLEYIHSKGLVHRDIKASNIVLDDTGHATILDFGILRDLKSKEALTAVGMLIGTPHYVSPEQILGKPFDARSDLYAVGVLLYELLTGQTPFDAENEFDLVKMHVKAPPPDPCERNPELPAAVGEVLRRAIAKDPAKRFQTAGELARAFEQAFVPEEVEAEDPTSQLPVDRPEPDGPTVPFQVQPELERSAAAPSSRTALWAGVALGVLASVATAVIVLLNVSAGAPIKVPEAVPLAPVTPVQPKPPKPAPPKQPARPAPEETEAVEEEEEEEADAGADEAQGEPEEKPDLLRKAVEKDPAKLLKLRHP